MFDFFSHRSTSATQALFFVPQPDPFKNPLVEIDPAQLRQWATALPFANQTQLAETVITSLSRLNRFPGAVKKRAELMEIYTTPCVRLNHGSAQREAEAPLQLIRRVMLEMAYGYSHIANECINTRANRKNLQRLTHAIYFATKYYILEYLLACEDFDCRSGRVYRDVTRLMTYAEEQNIHHIQIEDNDQNQPEHATIGHQYNRFLLLLLLDPCHLQQGELRLCFDFLVGLAGKAHITPATAETDATGRYVIDRLGEVPPYLFHPDCLDKLPQPRFALFDLSPVSKGLHKKLRQMERSEQGKPQAITKLTMHEATNLLARMLKSWHIRLKRDSERHSTSGEVMLWIGIDSIYTYLNGKSITTQLSDDEIDMTQLGGIQGDGGSPENHQISAVRTNQSRSGVALKIAKNSTNAPLVGELVLFSSHQQRKESDWKLGIVKRALSCNEELLDIGIQFILGNIEPITLRLANQQQTSEEVKDRPAIFIDQGHTHRSSLIVPKNFFVIGQEYRVEEMVPAPTITPLQLLETTAKFERYRIKSS
ncbi:MAG: flavoprotein [gamma proteobacterium symbiont of Ctena orbiculata]|nr:MAG: flavoprotein [gamma proteobacterium symbiont of Ctena orbiculata]